MQLDSFIIRILFYFWLRVQLYNYYIFFFYTNVVQKQRIRK